MESFQTSAEAIQSIYDKDPLEMCIFADEKAKDLGVDVIQQSVGVDEIEAIAAKFCGKLKKVFLESAKNTAASGNSPESKALASAIEAQIAVLPPVALRAKVHGLYRDYDTYAAYAASL